MKQREKEAVNARCSLRQQLQPKTGDFLRHGGEAKNRKSPGNRKYLSFSTDEKVNSQATNTRYLESIYLDKHLASKTQRSLLP